MWVNRSVTKDRVKIKDTVEQMNTVTFCHDIGGLFNLLGVDHKHEITLDVSRKKNFKKNLSFVIFTQKIRFFPI